MGLVRFVGLVVDSVAANHAAYVTRPGNLRRLIVPMPASFVLMRLSRCRVMCSSSIPMGFSVLTPAKLRLWRHSCLERPRSLRSHVAFWLWPFVLIERVRLLPLGVRIHSVRW